MLMGLSRVRVSGPLSAFATGFADHLTRQGYSPRQTRLQLLLLNHLSNWLASEGLVVGELRAKEVEQFQLSRDEVGYRFFALSERCSRSSVTCAVLGSHRRLRRPRPAECLKRLWSDTGAT